MTMTPRPIMTRQEAEDLAEKLAAATGNECFATSDAVNGLQIAFQDEVDEDHYWAVPLTKSFWSQATPPRGVDEWAESIDEMLSAGDLGAAQ